MTMQVKLLIHKTVVLSALLLAACGPTEPAPQPVKVRKADKEYKEPLIEVSKRMTEGEALQIDKYIKRHGLTVTETETGLRYVIYKKAPGNPPMPKREQVVLIHFSTYLLNGDEIYTSRTGNPVPVTVDKDDIESGVHEGLKYMHLGDKAKFILPSHLAHGVVGDNNKIPPLTPVVYDIELLSIK